MPTGKVKFFNAEKGFGFLVLRRRRGRLRPPRRAARRASTELKPGQRVEFGIVSGRKGNQALRCGCSTRCPSVARATRKPAEEMAPLVEDLIKLLDSVSNSLRRGRYPERAEARKVAGLLRAFADNLDA